jgi:UDP-glucose 4-epimerase
VPSESYRGYFRDRRVLITGGLGFIGIHLCLRLLELEAEITLVDNFVPPEPSGELGLVCSQTRVVTSDIRNCQEMEKLVRGQDVIFNLAGKSGAADSNQHPLRDLDSNCGGHLSVLEACRAVNPRVRIVFPSTRLVYGKPQYLPVDEGHPLAPESIYAVHKLTVENYLFIFARLHGMQVTVLRISNPYGPMHSRNTSGYSIASQFIRTAVEGGRITLFGNGEQLRDYLYIDDLVDALLCSAWSAKAGNKIYNIGSREGTSLLQLAELAVAAAGRGEIVRVPWPPNYQTIETGDYISDISRAECELGWSPAADLRAGVYRTVEFYRHSLESGDVLPERKDVHGNRSVGATRYA